jgi:hypothetical protein
VGAITRHGFLGIGGAAKDVSPKRSEILKSTPHPLDCRRKGEAKRGNERNSLGASGGTGPTGARDCPTHSLNRHCNQSRDLQPPHVR